MPSESCLALGNQEGVEVLGASAEAVAVSEHDVVVIGGGLAGTIAAIAAARLGCTVALLQDRPVLGGNSSSEIRVGIHGATGHGLNRNARETGILEELFLEDRHRASVPSKTAAPRDSWDWVLWEWVKREPNIMLYLNTRARQPEMATPSRIAAVLADQTTTETSLRFEGKLFIDASGDGTIAASAGAEYRMGREARHEHGESLAPLQADREVLSPSLLFHSEDIGRPAPFQCPLWARVFETDDDLPFRPHQDISGGYWWLEYGGIRDVISEAEGIREELVRIVFGIWDHIKNRGDHGAENFILNWVGHVIGKRESRRFMGDHILCQSDLESQRLFPDRVAYGGWPIDLHPTMAIYAKQAPGLVSMSEYPWGTVYRGHLQEPPPDMPTYLPPLPGPYSIPLRSLYSRNIDNLFLAGRNISHTHVAFGSTRLMATCAVEGQAVGTAAWLCLKYGTTPRGVYKGHIRELQQQLLKDDCYIIGLGNEDPLDVARSARVTGSSEAGLEVTTAARFLPLDVPRGQMFCGVSGRVEQISVLLKSTRPDPVEVEAELFAGERLDDFRTARLVASAKATVSPGRVGWVNLPFHCEVSAGMPYWIRLPAVPSLSWGEMEPAGQNAAWSELAEQNAAWAEPVGTQRGQWFDEFGFMDRVRGTHCFRVSPGLRPYGASNVINGVARPEVAANLWISDPQGGLPQWIELEFPEAQWIDAVYVTFDTNRDRLVAYGNTPECVRDYRIRVHDGSSYREVAQIVGNYQRRRIHRFESILASKLRLVVEATNGAPEARICEIRAYHEKGS